MNLVASPHGLGEINVLFSGFTLAKTCSVVSAFGLMEHVLPAFADGLAHFFGAVVNLDVTLPDSSDNGNIKTVQYVFHLPHHV
jgi:hypothetical protein